MVSIRVAPLVMGQVAQCCCTCCQVSRICSYWSCKGTRTCTFYFIHAFAICNPAGKMRNLCLFADTIKRGDGSCRSKIQLSFYFKQIHIIFLYPSVCLRVISDIFWHEDLEGPVFWLKNGWCEYVLQFDVFNTYKLAQVAKPPQKKKKRGKKIRSEKSLFRNCFGGLYDMLLGIYF